MEALTRLVTESLVRHGFDRPPDYRRLQWSRWFRCESHHSLLFVPSKPGVFAVAEEVADFSTHVAADASHVPQTHVAADAFVRPAHVETSAPGCPAEQRSAAASSRTTFAAITNREGHDFSRAEKAAHNPAALAAGGNPRRMLAVTQFFEDDDMAFVLDRMLSRENPMRARLISGRYFVRFVVIEDQSQRRSVCSALNQWMTNSAENATGIGSHFATSLELTSATEYIPQPDDAQQNLFDDANVGRTLLSATADTTNAHVGTAASQACPEPSRRVPRSEASGSATEPVFFASNSSPTAPHLDSGAASNIHCPSPLPSGF